MYLYPAQLNLVPSTDTRLTFMMSQMNQLGPQSDLDMFYHELGSVGFYGILDCPETLISILLLTNYSDVLDANKGPSFRGGKTCFNNIQQYIVPDIQMNLLKRALKKIIQTVTKGFDKRVEQDLENTSNAESETDDPLTDLLIQKADFGVLFLLGKLYFHVCKFRQSIYCLQMAVRKSRSQKQINQRDLLQSMVWLIFVQKMYLVNRVRIYERFGGPKQKVSENRKKVG